MEPVGQSQSQFRPYYHPSSTPYASGHTELLNTTTSDTVYDLLDSTSLWDATTAFLQVQLTNYFGIALVQPFDNAKILLQCQLIPKGLDNRDARETQDRDDYDEEEEEDPDYFADEHTHRQAEKRTTDGRGYIVQRDGDEPTRPPWQIAPISRPTISSVMNLVWSNEGMASLFKATNLSFLYNFAKAILEGQFSGLLSVLVGIPDPILALEAGDTASLLVNIASSCLTAVILAPLDIARTKIILTPRAEPRGTWHTLQTLPSRLCPPELMPLTILERAVPALVQHYLQPIFDPLSSIMQLSVRLPLETILHRAQAAYSPPRKSVVHLGAYTGILGTPLWMTRQEGDGFLGLYRGWLASVGCVVGFWTLGLFAASLDSRQEF